MNAPGKKLTKGREDVFEGNALHLHIAYNGSEQQKAIN